MTGTIFGGKGSSLGSLLYRVSPEARGAYTDFDRTGRSRIRQKEWSQQYGVEQEIETVTIDEDGKLSGKSRSNVRIRELPGASPAMLPSLINRSVFGVPQMACGKLLSFATTTAHIRLTGAPLNPRTFGDFRLPNVRGFRDVLPLSVTA